MGTIDNEKGFIFSIDMMLALLITMSMMYFMFVHLNLMTESSVKAIEKYTLQRKGIVLLDTIVKNNDSENPVLGSAKVDVGLKRVKVNDMDEFRWNNELNKKEINSGEIKATLYTEEEEMETNQIGNCIVLKRFVLVEGNEKFLYGVICNEK